MTGEQICNNLNLTYSSNKQKNLLVTDLQLRLFLLYWWKYYSAYTRDCDIHCAASLPPEQLQMIFTCRVQLVAFSSDSFSWDLLPV